MGYRAHIHTKHIIEYGGSHFNRDEIEVCEWLRANGVDVIGAGEFCENGEWEIEKSQLAEISESAYDSANIAAFAKQFGGNEDKARQALRDFVGDLLNADTGDYAYVSWF